MKGHNHPLRKYRSGHAGQTFEEQPDGTVLVTADDGRTGRFQTNGRYIEGDLTQTNKHMLYITGGPPIPESCRFRWGETPVDPDRPSGWPEELEDVLRHQLG
jgi:hypothetical protein